MTDNHLKVSGKAIDSCQEASKAKKIFKIKNKQLTFKNGKRITSMALNFRCIKHSNLNAKITP
jgi:hypothetical protein